MFSGNDNEPTEESVLKDVTIILSRIGEWRAQAKPKWIDFSQLVHKGEAEGTLVYKVSGNFCI